MNTVDKDNEVINSFIIDVTLIDPIEKIISGLKNHKFRNIDIDYLDRKLEEYASIACKLLNIDVIVQSESSDGKMLNDFNVEQYIERFTILLDYFKTLK